MAIDPKSPFFGADATPVASAQPGGSPRVAGRVWGQVIPSATQARASDSSNQFKAVDSVEADKGTPAARWGQLGA